MNIVEKENMNKVIKTDFRTINMAVAYFKVYCPKFTITNKSLKRLCENGLINSFKNGNRTMVDIDDAIAFFNGEKVKVA